MNTKKIIGNLCFKHVSIQIRKHSRGSILGPFAKEIYHIPGSFFNLSETQDTEYTMGLFSYMHQAM